MKVPMVSVVMQTGKRTTSARDYEVNYFRSGQLGGPVCEVLWEVLIIHVQKRKLKSENVMDERIRRLKRIGIGAWKVIPLVWLSSHRRYL